MAIGQGQQLHRDDVQLARRAAVLGVVAIALAAAFVVSSPTTDRLYTQLSTPPAPPAAVTLGLSVAGLVCAICSLAGSIWIITRYFGHIFAYRLGTAFICISSTLVLFYNVLAYSGLGLLYLTFGILQLHLTGPQVNATLANEAPIAVAFFTLVYTASTVAMVRQNARMQQQAREQAEAHLAIVERLTQNAADNKALVEMLAHNLEAITKLLETQEQRTAPPPASAIGPSHQAQRPRPWWRR